MQSPSLGTYALSFLLAGVGGWAVSQSLQDDPAPAPAAAVAPATPAPVNVTIVNPGTGPAAATGAVATYAGGSGSQAGQVRLGGSTGPRLARTQPAVAHRVSGAAPTHRARAAAQRRSALSPVGQLLLAPSVVRNTGGTNVIASNGAIVYIGDHGHLIANTGQVASSGIVALGVNGSHVGSGDSQQNSQGGRPAGSTQSAASTAGASDANGSFASIGSANGGFTSVAVSGFEDHSVSVIGDNQITTYDDSNVFINRDGNINANTGDTDSSGLNAVDVTGSIVRSGNSGDGEGDEGEDSDDEGVAPAPAAGSAASQEDSDAETSASSDEQDGADDDQDQGSTSTGTQGNGASVTDEGTSSATGGRNMVIGADGYDDVSIRSHGNGNITSYDDSNVVIGGHGDVNAQIGDSDTGGAVVMGVHNSDVQAGCEGDLCYSGSHR